MWDYTEKVREHFLNPRNVGVVENANGVGEVGSLSCGDALKLTIRVGENDIIEDAKFQTFGCASAIASSSALTEMVKGLSLDEAAKITNDDIAEFLGGLPKEKIHCSVMGRDGLERAIADYRGEVVKETLGNVVCECFGVTDLEIERAVKEDGLTTIDQVIHHLKAGGGCGKCHDDIEALINKVKGDKPMEIIKPVRMSNMQKIKLIESTLEREIKPALQKDRGDIELVDVVDNKVYVRLQGSCATCSKSQVTLKNHVEAKLRELVTQDLVVEEVK
ncbi:nitrogen fixation protein NifU [Desulfoluna limicola]|uniref:Nitrogen fixation protein NifU n=1 Tax=Desulfoluna limicola TaxID=2810562 RepID=A0ABN6FA27_9BACT|nr:Fe-S cluster assembly protein NifU [Desulfoluna limicola]BCS99071.1 nitrogen fixation protein NifU [Desulfoluna limicola]